MGTSGWYFGSGILLATVVGAVVVGIFPRLRAETSASRNVDCWVDLWVPILLSIPVLGLFGVAMNQTAVGNPEALRLAVAPWVVVATLVLAAGYFFGMNRRGMAGADSRQALVCLAMGVIFIMAAWADRLAQRHGQVLFCLAFIWLWLMSPDEEGPENTPPSGPVNDDEKVNSGKRPQFVVAWGGPLTHPPTWLLRMILVAGTGGLLGLFGLMGRQSGTNLPTMVLILTSAQALTLIGLGIALGRSAVERAAVSTMVLSICAALGAVSLRMLRWDLLLNLAGADNGMVGQLHLFGVRPLLVTGVVLLLVGAILLPRIVERDRWRFVLAAFLLFAALAVTVTGWMSI